MANLDRSSGDGRGNEHTLKLAGDDAKGGGSSGTERVSEQLGEKEGPAPGQHSADGVGRDPGGKAPGGPTLGGKPGGLPTGQQGGPGAEGGADSKKQGGKESCVWRQGHPC